MKISAIIPVYNAEAYLREALDSIIRQTFSDFEVICVDDGSTDNSVAILREYEQRDTRFMIIYQDNAGAGAARNNGARNASGEYYIFLDSDDFIRETMFEKMLAAAEKTGTDMCMCEASRFNEAQGEYITDIKLKDPGIPHKTIFSRHDMPDKIFNAFIMAPWNKIVSADFFHRKGLRFQEIMRANDMFFSLSALVLADSISLVKESLIVYRVGSGTNAQATNVEHPLDFYKALCEIYDLLIKNNIFDEVERSFINCVASHSVYNLNSQEGSDKQSFIFDALRNDVFPRFKITEYPHNYFYDKTIADSIRAIVDYDMLRYIRFRLGILKKSNQRLIAANSSLKKKNGELSTQNKRMKARISRIESLRLYKLYTRVTKLLKS